MDKSWNCIGLGLCTFDHLSVVENFPELNQKTEAVQYSEQGGGPVATAMVTLGKLGVSEIAFVGKIGDDQQGASIKQEFDLAGVNTDYLKTLSGVKSAEAFVWIEKKSGKRSVVLNCDADLKLTKSDISPDLISDTKYLLIDGRDADATLLAAREARKSGAEVVMDAGSLRPRMDEFFQLVDYFICSQNFLEAYAQKQSVQQAMEKIYNQRMKVVAATSGENGAIGFDGDQFYHQPAFPVKTVDTTGAGDVFHGAFIFGLLQGWNLPQNLLFSNAVAALKCTKIGGRQGIPDFEQIEHFLSLNGVHDLDWNLV